MRMRWKEESLIFVNGLQMLHTYYRHKDTKQIRQYEMQNFLALYEAYKAMKGNSFIDEIHEDVTSWEIIT